MRLTAVVAVALLVACGLAMAADTSSDVEALKAKYDAQIQQLRQEFQNELQKLTMHAQQEEAAEPPKWYDNIMINGYFQARYHARAYDFGEAYQDQVSPQSSSIYGVDEFEMRRLYVNLIAPLDHTTQAVVTWAGVGPNYDMGTGLASEADWANVFVDFMPEPEWTFRIGQAPTMFGIDVCESSCVRMNPERWQAGEGNADLGLVGLYFAGPWDRGIWIINDQTRLSDDGTGLRSAFSVHNGNFRNNDDDDHKNLSLDLEYFDDWGQYGVSWLDGEFAGNPREAFGINVRVRPGTLCDNWGFQAEWLDGKWFGTDRDGWYGQVSYEFDQEPATAYMRYEEFDPNKNASNDEYEGLHLGYAYNLTPKDLVTLEYTLGELGPADADDFIAQYQRMF